MLKAKTWRNAAYQSAIDREKFFHYISLQILQVTQHTVCNYSLPGTLSLGIGRVPSDSIRSLYLTIWVSADICISSKNERCTWDASKTFSMESQTATNWTSARTKKKPCLKFCFRVEPFCIIQRSFELLESKEVSKIKCSVVWLQKSIFQVLFRFSCEESDQSIFRWYKELAMCECKFGRWFLSENFDCAQWTNLSR